MKKVLVINSPLPIEQIDNNSEDYLPPIGLGIIYSHIEKICDAYFIDALAENRNCNDILDLIIEMQPHYICINIFIINYSLVKYIVENLKMDISWIIGGNSTKSLYSEIFEWETHNPIDIVYGDGELIIKNIIRSIITEAPYKTKSQNRRYFIVHKNSEYYVSNISNELLNRSIFTEPKRNHFDELEICIYTSRGCPYNCAYCVAACSRNTELGNPRHKDKDSIIKELNIIKQTYKNVSAIRILDDLFLSGKSNFQDAIDIFSKFKFSWRAMCHIKSINMIKDDILIDIAKSGCRELFVGIESGSPDVLKKIHKTDDIPLIIKSVERILMAGISLKGYFICGFPGETQMDLQKTFSLATKLSDYNKTYLSKFRNSTFLFRPYTGTELYDEIISSNNIEKNTILYKIKVSEELNKNSGYSSFNFDSGNYSDVSDKVLLEYINKIKKLNE